MTPTHGPGWDLGSAWHDFICRFCANTVHHAVVKAEFGYDMMARSSSNFFVRPSRRASTTHTVYAYPTQSLTCFACSRPCPPSGFLLLRTQRPTQQLQQFSFGRRRDVPLPGGGRLAWLLPRPASAPTPCRARPNSRSTAAPHGAAAPSATSTAAPLAAASWVGCASVRTSPRTRGSCGGVVCAGRRGRDGGQPTDTCRREGWRGGRLGWRPAGCRRGRV